MPISLRGISSEAPRNGFVHPLSPCQKRAGVLTWREHVITIKANIVRGQTLLPVPFFYNQKKRHALWLLEPCIVPPEHRDD
jgi:hypothetical protein